MDEPTIQSEIEVAKPLSQEELAKPPVGVLPQRVADIISRGQKSRPGSLATLVLLLLTMLLTWLSFPPVDFGALAWICLVPFLQLVRLPQRTRWMYRTTYFIGLGYWLVTLQWMRLGDQTMYYALVALSAYLAFYWVFFLWLSRTAVHQLKIPLFCAAPVLWVGLEYARAHLLTGFSWYYLGHSQYRWVNLIQISDLAGAYLVSFLVVMANASLAELIPNSWLKRWNLCWRQEQGTLPTPTFKLQWIGVSVSLGLVLLSSVYGMYRRSDETFPRGPRVALIQGNFVASVRNNTDDPRDIYMTHRELTGMTVGDAPDIAIWPEGMFPYGVYLPEQGVTDEQLKEVSPEIPVEFWRGAQAQQTLTDVADMMNTALIIGSITHAASPASMERYNSALFFQPGVGLINRYDKIHRVPFGEYIPLRDSLPLLQNLTPFRGRFGIDRGEEAHVFRYQDWEFIPLICFEDTVPHLVRRIAHTAKVNGNSQNQILVNLTNDGWFHGSSELDQHLITSQFRAVETRTPLVRAVNTGISAIIDGDGVVRTPDNFIDGGTPGEDHPRRRSIRDPKTGRYYKQLNCALVADVPLDPRKSFYVTTGDLFAVLCLAGVLAVILMGVLSRKPVPAREQGE
ncbi:MAG TPA: apolipoprotein N-acyltransferase [Planctomicrobium sp.]|nr:apolipoprotein N-acyltransferase [Planctomicrobium sp.]